MSIPLSIPMVEHRFLSTNSTGTPIPEVDPDYQITLINQIFTGVLISTLECALLSHPALHWGIDPTLGHWLILHSQYLDIFYDPNLNKDTDFYFRALVHSFHQSFICYIYCVSVFVLMVRVSVFLSLPAISLHVKTPIPLQDSWSKTDPSFCISHPTLLLPMTSV